MNIKTTRVRIIVILSLLLGSVFPASAGVLPEWTIMVFMNGKNSLSPLVITDLNELEKSGPSKNITIVVEAGRAAPDNRQFTNPEPGTRTMPQWTTPSTNWTGVRRYEIVRDSNPAEIKSPVIELRDNADMGDYKELADFITWSKTTYPARQYMLILWGHGDGWRTKALVELPLSRKISVDTDTGNSIKTPELALALSRAGGVDLYASDSCFMQMAEVAYEIRQSAPIILGSEDLQPTDGWQYDSFLNLAKAHKGELTPAVMAKAALSAFRQTYNSAEKRASQSAINAARLPELKTILDQWAQLAMQSEEKAAILDAAGKARNFKNAQGIDQLKAKDLLDFLNITAATVNNPELQAKTLEAADFISKQVVLENVKTNTEDKPSNGLAIYFPLSGFDRDYLKLDWGKDGKWAAFIQWLTQDSTAL